MNDYKYIKMNQNYNNFNNYTTTNKEKFHGGVGYGVGYGGSRDRYRGRHGGGNYGGGRGGYGWWYPYFNWSNWYPYYYPYDSYSYNSYPNEYQYPYPYPYDTVNTTDYWRPCPNGILCPPHLGCNDPACK